MKTDRDPTRSADLGILEEQDRIGYMRIPQTDDEWSIWEEVESWPEE